MKTRLLLLACALAPALALAEGPPESPAAAPPADPATAAPAEPPAAAPTPAVAPPAPAAPSAAEALPIPPPPPPETAPYPKLGFAIGAGFPQAATLSLLVRPLPWLRLSAGPSYDYVGWGYHGGLVLSPIRWAISPTLGLEGGRFFEVDGNRYVTTTDAGLKPLLAKVELQYVAATLGLEIGSQRGFCFVLRTGLSWLQVASHGTGQFTSNGGVAGANDAVITVSRPTVRASVPTVQLAFQYFL
jgi:hypothetical protein